MLASLDVAWLVSIIMLESMACSSPYIIPPQHGICAQERDGLSDEHVFQGPCGLIGGVNECAEH